MTDKISTSDALKALNVLKDFTLQQGYEYGQKGVSYAKDAQKKIKQVINEHRDKINNTNSNQSATLKRDDEPISGFNLLDGLREANPALFEMLHQEDRKDNSDLDNNKDNSDLDSNKDNSDLDNKLLGFDISKSVFNVTYWLKENHIKTVEGIADLNKTLAKYASFLDDQPMDFELVQCDHDHYLIWTGSKAVQHTYRVYIPVDAKTNAYLARLMDNLDETPTTSVTRKAMLEAIINADSAYSLRFNYDAEQSLNEMLCNIL